MKYEVVISEHAEQDLRAIYHIESENTPILKTKCR